MKEKEQIIGTVEIEDIEAVSELTDDDLENINGGRRGYSVFDTDRIIFKPILTGWAPREM
jgi:bacteriocin-like protein